MQKIKDICKAIEVLQNNMPFSENEEVLKELQSAWGNIFDLENQLGIELLGDDIDCIFGPEVLVYEEDFNRWVGHDGRFEEYDHDGEMAIRYTNMHKAKIELDRFVTKLIRLKKFLEEEASKSLTIQFSDEWITLTAAADLVGCHKGTVGRWANQQLIKDNGEKGRLRKVSKVGVLLMKNEKEDVNLMEDARDLRKDANNIRN
ncbi:hypothetical protein KAR91_58880 [Candidatus Pacearchaeota archaeon]|nr:hypothetical protein [Candidatus Pacearchaeota archaeon]